MHACIKDRPFLRAAPVGFGRPHGQVWPEGNLIFRPQKTSAFVTAQITGELAALIDRLLAWRGSKVDVSPDLLHDEEGYQLTKGQLREL